MKYNFAVQLERLLTESYKDILSERIKRGIRARKLLALKPIKSHNETVLRENR